MRRTLLLFILPLAACGSADPKAEATADRLEAAADQSDPASAARLEDAADAVRAGEGDNSASAPGSTAQNALEAAGSNSVTAAPPNAGPMSAPPPKEARPNLDGQVAPRPVIPPKAR